MKKPRDISLIIREISKINEKRTGYIFSLVHGKTMTYGLSHEVFRKCGKKNCKCQEGKLHGPYHALSINKNGGKKIVMIKKSDVPIVLKETKRYRYFHKTLSQVHKINKKIDILLNELKLMTVKDYP